jgi:tetratricopeptide (TPR) repeat protein
MDYPAPPSRTWNREPVEPPGTELCGTSRNRTLRNLAEPSGTLWNPVICRLVPSRALLCCAVVMTVAAGPQSPSSGPAAAYRQLVDDYRHQNAAALQRAAGLAEAEIRSFVDGVLNPAGELATWTGTTMLAAAMLHTDVCLWLLRSNSNEAAFAHLNAAIRLVEAAAPRDRSSQALAHRWYSNVSPLLIKAGAPVWGADLIKRSLPVLSYSDGQAAFARGLGLEIVACHVDAGVPGSRLGMRLSTPLHAAAGFYEEALRRDGSLYEAALHLGRSRLLLGQLADARRWLDVATQSPLASDRYLAFLYLGSMEEEDGRFDEAETRYRAAMSAFPWGQSGPLALARLLSRTNREAESRAVVRRMLERRGPGADPLWTYLASPGSEPGAVLHLMRTELWQ